MKHISPIEHEQWKQVPDFPLYQVSSLGRCKRTTPSGDVELRGKIDRLGYHQIGLTRNGRQVWFLTHRLIAAVFLSPEDPGSGSFLTVNHKDRNKSNNSVDNLEFVTVAENHRHWRKHPLHLPR